LVFSEEKTQLSHLSKEGKQFAEVAEKLSGPVLQAGSLVDFRHFCLI